MKYIQIVVVRLFKSLKEIMFLFGWSLNKAASKDELDYVISYFRPVKCNYALLRIGGLNDGGYLVPDDLGDIKTCFSIGVGESSSFEIELYDKNKIESYLADFSVDGPVCDREGFHFTKNYIGSNESAEYKTFSDWYRESNAPDGEKILQMDIEGGEWDLLIFEDLKILKDFRIIIIEFHDLDQISDRYSNKNIASMLRKLSTSFSPVYIAPNNETGFKKYDDIIIPRNIEVTYMRRDRLPEAEIFISATELNDFGSYQNNMQKKIISFSKHWFGN
jgi:hypothetical protein